MKTEQIIYAGYSRLKGELKFRTATNQGRVHQLSRTDDDLHMIEISAVQTKAEAAKQLLAIDHAKGDKEIEQLYSSKATDGNPFAKKAKAKSVTFTIKPTKVADEDKLSTKEAAKIREEFNAKVKEAYEAN